MQLSPPPTISNTRMTSLSDMLSSEIATLRAQAAALMSKAATLEAALQALTAVAVAEQPQPVAEQPQPQPEVVPEAEAPKVKKAPHSWALFFQRACAILKAAGYRGSLISIKPLWKQSHDWADADIVPAWLAFKAAAAVEAEAQAQAEAMVGGGGAAPAAAPAKPKKAPKKPLTPEQTTAKNRVAYLALHACQIEGMECYMNARGDVISGDGEWLGHWTGATIDRSVPEPLDINELTVED